LLSVVVDELVIHPTHHAPLLCSALLVLLAVRGCWFPWLPWLKPACASPIATQARGTVKDVVHVWELGGGFKLKDMLTVPVTASNISKVAVAITIDLGEPASALVSLIKWLELVRSQCDSLVAEYVSTAHVLLRTRVRLRFIICEFAIAVLLLLLLPTISLLLRMLLLDRCCCWLLMSLCCCCCWCCCRRCRFC
jgi:hypothetical protein